MYATGHYRHGVLLAPVTAQEVAAEVERMLDGAPETAPVLAPFSPLRFDLTPVPTLRINGEPRDVPAPLALDALLAHLGRDPGQPGVAVAVGDRVVPRSSWPTTEVGEGDRVEIITASQGG